MFLFLFVLFRQGWRWSWLALLATSVGTFVSDLKYGRVFIGSLHQLCGPTVLNMTCSIPRRVSEFFFLLTSDIWRQGCLSAHIFSSYIHLQRFPLSHSQSLLAHDLSSSAMSSCNNATQIHEPFLSQNCAALARNLVWST